MSPRIFSIYAVSVLGVVALFAVFILVRDHAGLIDALSAAGTVAAAGFAAVAALGSMRAANETRNVARHSWEAAARARQPHIRATVEDRDGQAYGVLHVDGTGAEDLTVVWSVQDAPAVSEQRADLAAGHSLEVLLDPGPVTLVWADYWDAGRQAHWRDVWGDDLHKSESQLVG